MLTIFEQICQTLAYAHDRRVIHRDLKPANVMVGAFGEVQVMDWGLAKVLSFGPEAPANAEAALAERSRLNVSSDRAASRAGTVMGTPAYMPPEQARGETELLDQRADVFGLGAILCEILTGRPPFIGRNANEVLARASRGNLTEAVKRLDECGADAELVKLTKACLAPEVDGRPRDGSAVAGQIAAYRAGVAERLRTAEMERAAAVVRAIEEKKRAIVEREKRRRTLALAAAVFLLLLGAGGGGWWWQQQQVQAAQRIRLALEDARERLDQAKRTANMELYPEALASLDKARAVARTAKVGGSIQTEIDTLEQRRQTEFEAASKSRRLLTACLEVRQPRGVKQYERSESGLMTALTEPSADEQFALAFRSWAPEFDVARPDEAFKQLQALPEPVVQELVAALDEWWQARRDAQPPGDWRALHDLADRLDANELRRELRGLLASGELERERRAADFAAAGHHLSGLLRMGGRGRLDEVLGAAALAGPPMSRTVAQAVGRNRTRLRDLAGRIDPHEKSLLLTVLALARAFSRSGDVGSAEEVLGRALTARPGEVVLLMALGELLERRQPPRLDRAIECYRAARAIRSEFGVALGKALNTAHRSDEGEAVLRELLRGQPDHPELHVYLGYALSNNKELSAAEAEYREAIRLKPDYPAAHFNLGLALQTQGKLPEAVAEYREAIRLKPNYPEAHTNKGNVLENLGNLPEALAAYHEAIRLKPDLPEAHNGLGIALRVQGKLSEAVAEYREAIRLKPDEPVIHNNLGSVLSDQGHLPEALAEFREAILLNPYHPDAHYNRGIALKAQGNLPEALSAYRVAIALKPDYAEAHCNLGIVLHAQGKLPEAVAEFREAIRLKPNLPEAHCNLGFAHYRQGKLPEAVAEYHEAIRLKPDDPEFHNGLGNVLHAQGKLPESLAAYRVAIALKPDYAEAHCNLGVVLQDQDKLPEAVAEFHEAIRLNPNLPDAKNNLGFVYYRKGKLPEAIAEFREAIRLKPDFLRAHVNLGFALEDQGKIAEAVAEHNEVIRLKPDYPEAHYNLGLALQTQGKLPEALAEYREAIRLKPDYPEAHCNNGLVLRQLGEFEAALTELQRGHELGVKTPGWRHPSARWVRDAERLVELDRRLPRLLDGGLQPATPAACLEYASLCMLPVKRLHATAARLAADAFLMEPELAADLQNRHRYDAACSAALAAAGQAQDAKNLPDKVSAGLRRQALLYLRADLALYAKLADNDQAAAKATVRQGLMHWQQDADLVTVRDAINQLPETECAAWRQLWQDVEALRQRAATPK